MQYCPAPNSSQRPAAPDPRTSYPTPTNKQPIPGIIQFGGVALVDDWFQVQPNRRHVQQGQYPGTQALHPGVQHAHQGQPQHPQAPAPYSNPYPPSYPHAQAQPFLQHPNQVNTSHPHLVGPSQTQYQPTRPHGPISRLANGYRLATRRQAANGQWPPVNHNRANQIRPPGPPNGINQNQQAPCPTTAPGGQFQRPQSDMLQPSFPNPPPEAHRNVPPHPPGLPIPPAILQKPILPPRFHNQHNNVQGYDAHRQSIPNPGNDEVYQPPLPPTTTTNVYDVPTPRGPTAPRVDNDRTPRAFGRVGEKTDSSSEARGDTTDTESVASGFSSSVGSGRATTCTSLTSGSEHCASPLPPAATVIVQRSRAPEDNDTIDDELQGMAAGYANKYKQEGLDALLNELIQNGTLDYRRSLRTAKAAKLVFEQLGKDGIPHVERLQPALRFEALRKFRTYWNAAGERSRADDEQFSQNPYSALPGVNIAGFVGSLFRTSILSADEVHMCLGVLMMNPLQLHSTCAMHALVVHCDGRLCADQHWPGTSRFCTTLKAHSQPVDEINWDSDDTSLVLVSDILGVIDRWRATVELQTIRDAVDPVTMKTKG